MEYRKEIAQEREEIAYIDTPKKLRINKSIKSSPIRIYR